VNEIAELVERVVRNRSALSSPSFDPQGPRAAGTVGLLRSVSGDLASLVIRIEFKCSWGNLAKPLAATQ